MKNVVMKFGGTSVADEAAIRRVTPIVRQQIERQPPGDRLPVVVVSALSKVTDGLLQVGSFHGERRTRPGDHAG